MVREKMVIPMDCRLLRLAVFPAGTRSVGVAAPHSEEARLRLGVLPGILRTTFSSKTTYESQTH